MTKQLTWEQIRIKETGTILHDQFKDGLRFIVMRGPSSLCAYVGVPIDHPLAHFDYDDLPVTAHGGLTFAGEGDKWRPEGFYWYGWDYSHAGDKSMFAKELPDNLLALHGDDKEWLVQDVIRDSEDTLFDFKSLLRLAEQIKKETLKEDK